MAHSLCVTMGSGANSEYFPRKLRQYVRHVAQRQGLSIHAINQLYRIMFFVPLSVISMDGPYLESR